MRNDAESSYSLIVVGTGFASSFFLWRYLQRAGPGERVLVLERGQRQEHRDQIKKPFQEILGESARHFVNRNPDKPWIFRTLFGGGSNCWVGNTPRQLPEDFEPRSRYGVGARVESVDVGASLASGVTWSREGRLRSSRGELVAVGANAIMNPHLLLRSGLEHPRLGRGLCEQVGVLLDVHLDGVDNFQGSTLELEGCWRRCPSRRWTSSKCRGSPPSFTSSVRCRSATILRPASSTATRPSPRGSRGRLLAEHSAALWIVVVIGDQGRGCGQGTARSQAQQCPTDKEPAQRIERAASATAKPEKQGRADQCPASPPAVDHQPSQRCAESNEQSRYGENQLDPQLFHVLACLGRSHFVCWSGFSEGNVDTGTLSLWNGCAGIPTGRYPCDGFH
jgi:hypothetical protein